MDKIRFLMVGSGFRAKLYTKIVKRIPNLFEALVLCRTKEKALLFKEETKVNTTDSLDEAISFKPMFVVVVVNKENIADVAIEWLDRGYPVLTETPIASSIDKLLKLYELAKKGAKIAASEQYQRYPYLASIIKSVEEGLIGKPLSLYISLAHDYHASSLIRRCLNVSKFRYIMHGITYLDKDVVVTSSREGIITDGRRDAEKRNAIFLDFEEGKHAVYDFSGLEYRSLIRARTIIVRGTDGEIRNNEAYYVVDGTSYQNKLKPYIEPRHLMLAKYFNIDKDSFDLSEENDMFAVSTVLYDMYSYALGGDVPYKLEYALDDVLFWLNITKATTSKYEEVKQEEVPWNSN